MGLSRAELDDMSWWELQARMAGFKAANGVGKPAAGAEPETTITPALHDALVARFADV